MWSESIVRSLCFPMPLYSGLVENPIAPVLFAQLVTLYVLIVLIGWSTLHFLVTGDIGMGLLAVRALHSHSPLLTTEGPQAIPSAGSSSR